MKAKLSQKTLDAIASIESSNPDFIMAAIDIFDTDFLPGEFSSSDVADALISRGIKPPTDWRVMGPLMRRAVNFGMIEPTGKVDIRRSITGHTSNHSQPTYRIVDPAFYIPPKKLRSP